MNSSERKPSKGCIGHNNKARWTKSPIRAHNRNAPLSQILKGSKQVGLQSLVFFVNNVLGPQPYLSRLKAGEVAGEEVGEVAGVEAGVVVVVEPWVTGLLQKKKACLRSCTYLPIQWVYCRNDTGRGFDSISRN